MLFLRFHSELFVHEQPDEDIDKYHVGGDCLSWFYSRLLTKGFDLDKEPLMEDWGWTSSARKDNYRYLFHMYCDFDNANYWALGIEVAKAKLFMKSEQSEIDSNLENAKSLLTEICQSNAIDDLSWHRDNPVW